MDKIKTIIGLLAVIVFLLIFSIKGIEVTTTGYMITFRDDTGYYFERVNGN